MASLSGTVTDNTRAPVEGAVVTVVELGINRTTAADGTYEFLNMPAGTDYHVTCTADGYNDAEAYPVVVEVGLTTTLDFELLYPEMGVSPLTYEHYQMGDTQQTVPDVITIGNAGNGELTWELSIAYGAKDDRDASVLLVTPDVAGGSDISNITNMLDGFADITYVLWDATVGTPSVVDMQAYDVVLVGNDVLWTSSAIDKTTLSNNLADLIDAGGAVLATGFLWSFDDWGLGGGRFMAEDYSPFEMASTDFFEATTLGTFDDTHPIMQGVTTATDGFNHQDTALSSNGTWVASWADSQNYVAVAPNCVGLNQVLYAGSIFGGDVDTIVYNSIMFLAGGGTPQWLDVDPDMGTIPAMSTADLDLIFDTTDLEDGDYTATLTITGDDADRSEVTVDITLHVSDTVPTPTPTMEPTSTPTMVTPTPTIEPTATPEPCMDFGVTMMISDTYVSPGEQFWVDAMVCNPDPMVMRCSLRGHAGHRHERLLVLPELDPVSSGLRLRTHRPAHGLHYRERAADLHLAGHRHGHHDEHQRVRRHPDARHDRHLGRSGLRDLRLRPLIEPEPGGEGSTFPTGRSNKGREANRLPAPPVYRSHECRGGLGNRVALFLGGSFETTAWGPVQAGVPKEGRVL